jgi:hypothetical protein
MSKRSDYTTAQWHNLYPEQRYAIEQAEYDQALGRNSIQVRAADGRGVVYLDPVTRQPIPAAAPRRVGGPV